MPSQEGVQVLTVMKGRSILQARLPALGDRRGSHSNGSVVVILLRVPAHACARVDCSYTPIRVPADDRQISHARGKFLTQSNVFFLAVMCFATVHGLSHGPFWGGLAAFPGNTSIADGLLLMQQLCFDERLMRDVQGMVQTAEKRLEDLKQSTDLLKNDASKLQVRSLFPLQRHVNTGRWTVYGQAFAVGLF